MIRSTPEDFQVDEVPAYLPSGQGEHLFVRFRKRQLNTPDAVRRIALALGLSPRDASWAGLKDRHAVTTQWASFQGGDAERARALALDGIEILEAARHTNKLRTGHLRGNRFELRVRGVPEARLADARGVVETLVREGVPNFFGEQRFGIDEANVGAARRWLVERGPAPRRPFERKLLVSVLQSAIFNTLLSGRMRDGTVARPLDGDLLRSEPRGGLFVLDDLEEATRRVASWEASPTGPMFGDRMRWPEREARKTEEAALACWDLREADLASFRKFGEGTRRPLRARLEDASLVEEAPGTLLLAFTLPKGSYATVVLRELLKPDPAPALERAPDARSEPDDAAGPTLAGQGPLP